MADRFFVVNKKRYVAKPFDFNMLCDLEDLGVSLESAQNKPMSMVRAYFSVCAGKGKEYAGKEMQSHMIAGGSLDEIVEAMSEEMNNSDFFQSLSKTTEADATTDSEKKQTKAKKSE